MNELRRDTGKRHFAPMTRLHVVLATGPDRYDTALPPQTTGRCSMAITGQMYIRKRCRTQWLVLRNILASTSYSPYLDPQSPPPSASLVFGHGKGQRTADQAIGSDGISHGCPLFPTNPSEPPARGLASPQTCGSSMPADAFRNASFDDVGYGGSCSGQFNTHPLFSQAQRLTWQRVPI